MQSNIITIDIPEDIVGIFNETNANLQKEIKQYLAVKFYHQSLLTIGKAAELAGMQKCDFEIFLSSNNLPISYLDFSDVSNDIKKLELLKTVNS